MIVRAPAIVCAGRVHGETGVVARVLTAEHGLLAGYVRGGRSRRLRPVLMVGNKVVAELRARVETQLPALTVELIESRAALLTEPLAAAAIEWVTALTAIALPEGHPYPRLYAGLSGMLEAIALAPSARGWAGGLVRYERALIRELGFGQEDGSDQLFGALRDNAAVMSAELLTERAGAILDARERLVERLKRAFGVDPVGR